MTAPPAPAPELDADTLRKLTRGEMVRVLEEFKSERDAAKRSVLRAFDERDIALNALAARDAEIERLRAALQTIADRGTRHDLTPTMMFTGDEIVMYASMCAYLQGADAVVRGIARAALAAERTQGTP